MKDLHLWYGSPRNHYRFESLRVDRKNLLMVVLVRKRCVLRITEFAFRMLLLLSKSCAIHLRVFENVDHVCVPVHKLVNLDPLFNE